jgi:hypothetical protein
VPVAVFSHTHTEPLGFIRNCVRAFCFFREWKVEEGEGSYCLCIECCRLYRLVTFVVASEAFVSSVISFPSSVQNCFFLL